MNKYLKIIYLVFSSLLTGCVLHIPVGDVDNSSVYWKTKQAYSYNWTYYSNIIQRNYFTLDSSLFSYLKFDKYLEREDGMKINIGNSLYFLQRDDSYKQFIPPGGATDNIRLVLRNNKIYVRVGRIPQALLTNCFAFKENVGELTLPETMPEYLGELNVEKGRFEITHFYPRNWSIEQDMRRHGYSDRQIGDQFYSMPLKCGDINQDAILEEFNAAWDIEAVKVKIKPELSSMPYQKPEFQRLGIKGKEGE